MTFLITDNSELKEDQYCTRDSTKTACTTHTIEDIWYHSGIMPPRKPTRNTLLRDLPPSVMSEIKRTLDPTDKWKDVAECILDSDGNEKFSSQDILNFELEHKKQKSPTEAIMRTWSFSNPTVQNFLHILSQAGVNSLIHFFLVKKMQEMTNDQFDEQNERGWDDFFAPRGHSSHSTRRLVETPIKEPCGVGLHEEAFVSGPVNEHRLNESGNVDAAYESVITEEIPGQSKHYEYSYLLQITDDFNIEPISRGGRLLGTGGYAHVFLGRSSRHADAAVKRLKHKDNAVKQFFKEVDVLSRFKHPNIIPLLGVSQDGPHWCIVSEYMENGSLEERLACKDGTEPLSSSQRSRICKGIAQGLNYLHTYDAIAYIHRDIKSANILLDYDFSAKIGDCGLAHFGPSDFGKTHTVTENIIGTTAYMAPEYFEGEISERLDAYAFGVVIFELLTALPSYDSKRENKNLSRHVKEYYREHGRGECIVAVFDRKVMWDTSVAVKVYAMGEKLTTVDKYDRPNVSQVLEDIMSFPEAW